MANMFLNQVNTYTHPHTHTPTHPHTHTHTHTHTHIYIYIERERHNYIISTKICTDKGVLTHIPCPTVAVWCMHASNSRSINIKCVIYLSKHNLKLATLYLPRDTTVQDGKWRFHYVFNELGLLKTILSSNISAKSYVYAHKHYIYIYIYVLLCVFKFKFMRVCVRINGFLCYM
jgi:hypothetical protein